MAPRIQETVVRAAFIALIFGVGVAFVCIRLLMVIWDSCDVGVNAGANLGGALLYAPIFTVIAGLACGLSFALVDFVAPRVAAYVATAAAAVLSAWVIVEWQHNPYGDYGDMPEAPCVSGVPPWWPDFIPL